MKESTMAGRVEETSKYAVRLKVAGPDPKSIAPTLNIQALIGHR